MVHALAAENVRAGQWQKVPVPAQPMFQNKRAYGKGWPWSCSGDGEVSYDLRNYPNSFSALENSFTVRGLVPPNGTELVDAYAAAFEKVFGNIDRVLAAYDRKEQFIPLEERIDALNLGA